MIIKDKIGNLLSFVKLCGLLKTDYLFSKFYTEYENGKFVVWNRTMTEIERVVYTPKEVKVDNALDTKTYKDGMFWGKTVEFVDHFKGHGISTEIEIEIDPEMVRGKYLSHTFKFRNCERLIDAGQELSPTNSYKNAKSFAEKYKAFTFPEKEGEVGLDWFAEKELKYCLKIDISAFKEIIACRKSYVNPSHFKINLNESGVVYLVISDDDAQRAGNEDTIEIGNIKYSGPAFSNVYRTGFDNIFENISGKAFIYFGVNTALVIHYVEQSSDKKSNTFDAMYLITTAKQTVKKPEPDTESSDEKPKPKKHVKKEEVTPESSGEEVAEESEGEPEAEGDSDEEPEEVDTEFEEDTGDEEPEEVEEEK